MANMPDEIVLARMMTTQDLGVQESSTLPWWRVWEQQWLWAPTPHQKTSPHLLHVFSRGLLQPSWLPHNPVPALTCHPKSSLRPAILRRGLLAPNFWWNTPTSIGSQWQNWMTPCRIRSQYQTAGNTSASMRFLGWLPHPHIHSPYQCSHPNSQIINFQTHHPRNLTRWKCPQNWNWWTWMYQILSKTW